LGARSRRPGKTRYFVGYKKHTLRLWISGHTSAIMLAPMISWVTPAHVPEGYLLKPSLWYCRERLHWWPHVVVGDMGYIHQETKRWLRTEWQIAVLTRLKANMRAASPYRHDQPMRCPQGQALGWLNYDAEQGRQWYGVLEPQALCPTCWQQSGCPREFAYEVAPQETFLGMIPLNTKAGWKLVHSARSWIEAGQSFEKNQLGLNAIFLNSLALTWTMSLLADSVALLRCLAQLRVATQHDPIKAMRPNQTTFDF
jgi:hypothetical protein